MNKIIYGVISGAVLFAACDDEFLTQEPQLSQSTEITMSTIEGLSSAAVGAYAAIGSAAWYGNTFIVTSEMRAGNARLPKDVSKRSGRLTGEYNWNYSSSSTYGGLWTYAYYTIANANNIIDNLGEKGTETQRNGLKAEALFIRALSHFDLVRTYCQPYTQTNPEAANSGVPVILHSTISEPARNTIAEVYAQIVADLLEAESLFPASYNTAGKYHTTVNDYNAVACKEAAQALLARVYTYMGQWQKAADYANKVINSGRYTLWTPDQFTKAFTQEAGSGEVIFETYGAEGNDRFGEDHWTYNLEWLSNPEGYADFGASEDIVKLYADDDIRGKMFAEVDGMYWTLKYDGKDDRQPSYNNTIVIRLSEMYLTRAEAALRGAQTGSSLADDMATVASKRGTSPEAATEVGLFTEIRKEFAFEGHVLYDFARFGRTIERKDTDCSEDVRTIVFPSYRWALPIPKGECDANKNMVQNPGY